MAALEPLCFLIGMNPKQFTKFENIILEGDLFARICEEIKEHYRKRFRRYFSLLKLDQEKENTMLNINFAYLILQDILTSQEYDLEGIARYTNSYKEVIDDILTYRNIDPSHTILRKLIELHRNVRRDLYENIAKKISALYLVAV